MHLDPTIMLRVVKRSNNIIPERASETVEAVKKQHKESKKMIGQCRKHLNSVGDDVRTLDSKYEEMMKMMSTLQKSNQALKNRVFNLEKRSNNMKQTIEDQGIIITEMKEENHKLTQRTTQIVSQVRKHQLLIPEINNKLDEVLFQQLHHTRVR